MEQNWQGGLKFAFLICDCPPHGDRYNGGENDSFPFGDPKGLIIENLMKEFANKGIKFTFIKILKMLDTAS